MNHKIDDRWWRTPKRLRRTDTMNAGWCYLDRDGIEVYVDVAGDVPAPVKLPRRIIEQYIAVLRSRVAS